MQHWSLIFVLLILILLVTPFTFKFRITYDAIKNYGVFTFKIFKFKVKFATFKFTKLAIVITSGNKKPKVSEIKLSVSKEQIVYVKELTNQLKDKVKVRNLFFASRLGTNDAFETAMLSASLNELVCGAFAFVKNFKQTCSISISCAPVYDKKSLFFVLNTAFAISIFDLIYCFIFAAIRKWRFKKYEKRIRSHKFD